MHKSIDRRLRELEALEATREQERQAQGAPDLPDVAAMDDDEVLWETTLAIRAWCLHPQLTARCGRIGLARATLSDPWYREFYAALAVRALPLLDALPKPILFLGRWEIEDMIQAIDAGWVITTWSEYQQAGVRKRQWFRLWPAWSDGAAYDEDLLATCKAIDTAHTLLQRQLHYPQLRDFSEPEFETCADWRAWLEGLL
jgi:hypothetical protein